MRKTLTIQLQFKAHTWRDFIGGGPIFQSRKQKYNIHICSKNLIVNGSSFVFD